MRTRTRCGQALLNSASYWICIVRILVRIPWYDTARLHGFLGGTRARTSMVWVSSANRHSSDYYEYEYQ
eukprot:scaffold94789_cov14-Prasinocladus_malaysianus.AAC.1